MLFNDFSLDQKTSSVLKQLKGPILIIGAGGFIGANIFSSILLYRKDVFGLSRNPKENKRFKSLKLPKNNILKCDINNPEELKLVLAKIKPKTIFNLSAYGAYSKQQDPFKIYQTNFLSTINLIEELKKYNFNCYIHAGSSSEYGENSNAPKEDALLTPNSHYAVSKAAVANALYYYGKVEHLPVIHFRLYAVYGPLEEKDRLIPTIIKFGEKKKYPSLASGTITRDFIYTQDVTRAFVFAAKNINKEIFGEAFNIGTGKKTSIKELAQIAKDVYKIKGVPVFGLREKRRWDHGKAWFANSTKAKELLGFCAEIDLATGLRKTSEFNKKVKY